MTWSSPPASSPRPSANCKTCSPPSNGRHDCPVRALARPALLRGAQKAPPIRRRRCFPVRSMQMVQIAVAQMDCVLGDPTANLLRAREAISDAVPQGADLVMFPELTLHGYALGKVGGDRSIRADDPRLTSLTQSGVDVLVGFHEDGGVRRYNSAAYLAPDGVPHVHPKPYFPT